MPLWHGVSPSDHPIGLHLPSGASMETPIVAGYLHHIAQLYLSAGANMGLFFSHPRPGLAI